MIARRLLLCLMGLLMVFSLSGCSNDFYEEESNWLVSEQTGDFVFRMTVDTSEYSMPSVVFEPGESFRVKGSLGYVGDDPVNIQYSHRLISIVKVDDVSSPNLIAPSFDPDAVIEEKMKKGDWTGGQDQGDREFTLPPGDYVIHGLAAFQVDGKEYELRTHFKVHVKKA